MRKFHDIRNMKQKIVVRDQNKVDSTAGVNAYHFDQNVSRNELTRITILHEYPLPIFDHIGFRRYSTSLQPLFKMVSRNTIKDILSIYDNESEKLKHEIDKDQVELLLPLICSLYKRKGEGLWL